MFPLQEINPPHPETGHPFAGVSRPRQPRPRPVFPENEEQLAAGRQPSPPRHFIPAKIDCNTSVVFGLIERSGIVWPPCAKKKRRKNPAKRGLLLI